MEAAGARPGGSSSRIRVRGKPFSLDIRSDESLGYVGRLEVWWAHSGAGQLREVDQGRDLTCRFFVLDRSGVTTGPCQKLTDRAIRRRSRSPPMKTISQCALRAEEGRKQDEMGEHTSVGGQFGARGWARDVWRHVRAIPAIALRVGDEKWRARRTICCELPKAHQKLTTSIGCQRSLKSRCA